ncbi:tyrosine-type recombinase/integrase [Rhizobium rhizogenes]|uniref:tyrosine-type recombinase/integrase n=1 Tax=Rhizobium rhizogenes TaxID=359 RepID=UPI00191F9565|nr:site-specific integrase [Rhizobium rhizogenes]WEO63549.1 tyrosine-type recombinase/integrase [Rhizobium rhizogenes]
MGKKLTAAFVRTVKEPGMYSDGEGLYLLVKPTGAKSWIQRIVIRQRRVDVGLGGASVVTLAEAREKAIDNRRVARAGGDPLAARQAAREKAREMPTFAEAMVEAHKELTFGNPKDGKAFLASLREYAVPRFGSMPVCDVTGPDVRAAVLAIRDEKPEIARKLVLRCSAVFKWAIGQGFRADNPSIAQVLALPKVSRKAQVKTHRKALPYAEVAACIETVKSSGAWTATKLAIEFLILTAARSGEVRGALWTEIDLAAGVWEIPEARMKMGKAHKVPLSPRAKEVLNDAQSLRDNSGLVFPSVRGVAISDMTMSKLVKELGYPVDIHGYRTSFRTWAQECTNFPFEVCEAALAHSVGDTASQAYARSTVFEKRRKLMSAWSSYLAVKRGEVIKLDRQGAMV